VSAYTLHLGDCLEYMRGMDAGSVDAVITDPQYGNGTEYNSTIDTPEFVAELVGKFIPEALRIAKRVVITPGVITQWLYPKPSWVLSWVTEGSTNYSPWGFSCWQPILVYGSDPFMEHGKGCRPDVIKCSYWYNGHKINHPCPKPVDFMRLLIGRCTADGESIFDPFMGSGTTGVACMQLGRNFIGCEIDPTYYAIAERRIRDAAAQPALFTLDAPQVKATQAVMI